MRARRRFGQNFLVDRQVVQRILETVAAGPQDQVLEIGPGRGALTQGLADRAGSLTLIEIDRDLAQELAARFGDRVRLIVGDALKVDIPSLCGDRRLRVLGNLPYNISTPLLFRLFEFTHCIADMHFMLQKEVVDRLAAAPSTADYGRLSIMAQYHCRIEKCFEVPPDAFRPVPAVDSAVVRLVPLAARLPGDPAALRTLVTAAFSARRKTIRNALQGLVSAEQMALAGIDPGLRPENLDLAQYLAMARVLQEAAIP